MKELGGAFAGGAVLEDGAACYQDLGAGAYDTCYCVVMDAAVHFDTKIQGARLTDFRQQLNFLKGGVDEALATEAGIHAPYQDVVNQGKNLVESVDGGGGIYDDAGFASVRGN